MTEEPGHTTIAAGLLERLRRGDESALEELIRHSMERLLRLTRRMMKGEERIRRWEQTDDVFQNSLIRLDRALREVKPDDHDQFVGLAALQIRRELVDLARHYFGPQGTGHNHATDPLHRNRQATAPALHDPGEESDSVAESLAIHEAVDSLPEEQQAVLTRIVYLGMSQAEVADETGMSVRTVKRRFREAKLRLEELLGDE